MTTISLLTAMLVLVVALSVTAQVSQLINYQGRVAVGNVNFDGAGLIDGQPAMVVYDGQSLIFSRASAPLPFNVVWMALEP